MIRLAGPALTKANVELVTLAELKTFLGSSASTEDTRMQQVVDGVNRASYDELRQRFVKHCSTDWDIVVDGAYDAMKLVLPYRPVSTWTSVSRGYYQNGTWVTDWTYDSSEYTRDDEAGLLYNTATGWPRGRLCLRVIYQAGWTSAPEDLKWAVLQWMHNEWKRVSGDRLDQTSESDEAGSTVYTFTTIPPSARRVLNKYAWKGAAL